MVLADILLTATKTSLPGSMHRRSVRIAQSELFKEQIKVMEARLSAKNDENLGMEVTLIENKGRGVKVWFNTLEYLLSYFPKRL